MAQASDRRTHLLHRVLALATALLLVAAACGGSDGESDVAAPSPTAEAAVEADPTAEPEPEPTVADDPEPEDEATEAVEDSEPAGGDTTEPAEEGDDGDDAVDVAPAAESIDWRPCGEVLCADVAVPADYDDDSLGTIDIAIAIHRAQDPEARVGYLFVNPGGPGEPGLGLAVEAASIFTEDVLDSFDIVGFDPRGVGSSEPTFACGENTEQFELLVQIEDLPDTDEEIALGNQAAQLCIDSMGPVGARLHSEFVARDIDEIRAALGAEQISYLGFSYGSDLGGWYASLFPERVYSMVLDGARNPLDRADNVEEAIELALASGGPIHDQLAAALASCDESCPIWNDGDPEGYWYANVDKFQLVADAKGGNNVAIAFGIVGHLYSEADWPALHQSLFDLGENDDPSGFVAAIDRAGTVDTASVTDHINCLDNWALNSDLDFDARIELRDTLDDAVEAAIEPELPLLFAVDIAEQETACVFYGSIDPPVFDGTFDGGGIPILVVGNTSDPVTPFIKSEIYANEVLSDGRLVKVAHPQHVVYPGNACVNDLVHDALIDQQYPDDEVTCEVEEGIGTIELVELELPDGSTTLRPAGWNEVAPLVFAKGDPSLDPTLLVFQETVGSVEDTIEFVETQLSGATAELVAEVEVDGATWSLYTVTDENFGITVRFAISPEDDGVLILGQTLTEDIDQLTDEVLNPVLQAFVFGE